MPTPHAMATLWPVDGGCQRRPRMDGEVTSGGRDGDGVEQGGKDRGAKLGRRAARGGRRAGIAGEQGPQGGLDDRGTADFLG